MPDPITPSTPTDTPVVTPSPIVAPPSPVPAPVVTPVPAPVTVNPVVHQDPINWQHVAIYGGVGLVETVCSAFDLALLNHSIVFPPQWAWVTVILQPVLIYITMTLPKLTDSQALAEAKKRALASRATP